MFRPCPYDPLWPAAERNRWKRRFNRQIANCHPWGAAARALSKGDERLAEIILKEWTRDGISHRQIDEIMEAKAHWFSELNKKLDFVNDQTYIPTEIRLLSLGLSLNDWQLHAWLHQLGLKNQTIITAHDTDEENAKLWPVLVVQFEAIAPYSKGQEQVYQLLELAHALRVYDVDETRVELLRRLGVNAQLLSLQGGLVTHDGWLADQGTEAAAAGLGLAQPSHLATVGQAICLGRSQELGWVNLLKSPLLAIPGFDEIITETWEQARSLASWIAGLLASDIKVVRLNPTDHEIRKRGFKCLMQAFGGQVHGFIDPIHPEELIREIHWREQGCKPARLPATPTPAVKILSESQQSALKADVTVCISLYNYSQTIIRALETVRDQQGVVLDVIVVDDGSTDGGEELVRNWMAKHQRTFNRAALLQHHENGGLAAARNTAFRWATTEWCFVLDADNALYPEAIFQCLSLADSKLEKLAVVHPLIEVIRDDSFNSETDLLSPHSWQQKLFEKANHVDAMALVRRSAWEDVGGYQHLPHGWEDYDFWCSLISKDYFGVICPQILATYSEHSDSMLRSQTNRFVRETSRMLKQRHPWITLSTATGSAEGGLG